jgi:hypothetical protein
MTSRFPIRALSTEQQELWLRVEELWALARSQDAAAIRRALHPHYAGWDMSAPLPHDRNSAVASVSGESSQLAEYRLEPLSVEVYDHRVGIVHYEYSARVVPTGSHPRAVTGKWTEIYLKQRGAWVMIGVSGRPDVPHESD